MVLSSQLHRWAWELPVPPSWLPRSTGNIIISHISLMCPLWRTKRPLLGLCSLLEEQAPSSLPQPGTAGRVVFPPQSSMKCPFFLAPNPCLSSHGCPHGSPEAGTGSSHPLPLGAPGGLCSLWWVCSTTCDRAATHPMDQEVSASRRSQNLL